MTLIRSELSSCISFLGVGVVVLFSKTMKSDFFIYFYAKIFAEVAPYYNLKVSLSAFRITYIDLLLNPSLFKMTVYCLLMECTQTCSIFSL
jgi:hypothetical protein